MKMSLRACFARVYLAYSCFRNNFNFKKYHLSNLRALIFFRKFILVTLGVHAHQLLWAWVIFKAICVTGHGPQNAFHTITAGEREKYMWCIGTGFCVLTTECWRSQ